MESTFDDFYRLYPRKKARGDAEKAWKQMIKQGFKPDEIIAGLMKNLPSLIKKDPQFVKYPASWLRAQCWFDEPDREFMPERRRTLADAANDLISDILNADRHGDAARGGPGRLN